MIWLVRFYLFFMGITYLLIGLWAILDPLFISMEISAPSFLDAVGLSITSEIGYSEIIWWFKHWYWSNVYSGDC